VFKRVLGRGVALFGLLTGLIVMADAAIAEVGVPDSYGAAMRWYRQAAEAGNAEAQYLLAQRYERGVEGPVDLPRAVMWYRRSAERGYAEAQFKLASMYATGAGVDADPARAVGWYEKAAGQGLAVAQYNLGVAYLNGEGVARDVDIAFAWLSIAASQDLAQARTLLDRLRQVLPEERVAAAREREADLRKKYAL
jgi:TPR repeat protein